MVAVYSKHWLRKLDNALIFLFVGVVVVVGGYLLYHGKLADYSPTKWFQSDTVPGDDINRDKDTLTSAVLGNWEGGDYENPEDRVKLSFYSTFFIIQMRGLGAETNVYRVVSVDESNGTLTIESSNDKSVKVNTFVIRFEQDRNRFTFGNGGMVFEYTGSTDS